MHTEKTINELIAHAERQRRLYEAILTNTPDLAYVFDLSHRFIYANEGLLRMWGKTWDEAIGKNCLELGYETWHAAMHDREIEQVIATKLPIRGEVPFTGTFGRRIYDYIFVPVFGPDGEVEAIAGTTRDVTEYRRHDVQLQLLVNELNHRVKNTLTMVQSLASQTFRRAESVAQGSAVFENRLIALSKAHDILTQKYWDGANLRDVVQQALAAYLDQSAQPRIASKGPEIRLQPRAVLALSMVFHELATNAAKYGALSNADGRVQHSVGD